MELIDKSALVTEIERLKSFYDDNENIRHVAKYNVLALLVNFLDALEVKEVDLEKEVNNWWNTHYSSKDYTFERYTGHYLENSTLIEIAKHFFELGLKAKGE